MTPHQSEILDAIENAADAYASAARAFNTLRLTWGELACSTLQPGAERVHATKLYETAAELTAEWAPDRTGKIAELQGAALVQRELAS